MNSKIYILFVGIIISTLVVSCSDAEIVSGVYKGRIYRVDTVAATATVVGINDSFVRIEVKADNQSTGYVEYAQLTKAANEAYNLILDDVLGGFVLTGYYYENALHINSYTSNYGFDGVTQ